MTNDCSTPSFVGHPAKVCRLAPKEGVDQTHVTPSFALTIPLALPSLRFLIRPLQTADSQPLLLFWSPKEGVASHQHSNHSSPFFCYIRVFRRFGLPSLITVPLLSVQTPLILAASTPSFSFGSQKKGFRVIIIATRALLCYIQGSCLFCHHFYPFFWCGTPY